MLILNQNITLGVHYLIENVRLEGVPSSTNVDVVLSNSAYIGVTYSEPLANTLYIVSADSLQVGVSFTQPTAESVPIVYNATADSLSVGVTFSEPTAAMGGTEFITTWRTTTASETITIPTTGTGYNYDIVTSDGQTFTGETGDKTITFASAGDYDVRISGDFPRIYFSNAGDKLKIIDIKQWGNIAWSSMERSFFGCSNLVGSFTDAPDLSGVTDMSFMFFFASSFNQPIGNWDVSNVTSMYSMFREASSFNQPIGNWDVSNITNMYQVFRGASSFNQTLNWDVSNVIDMFAMFYQASSFDQPLDWDVSNVTNMTQMFQGVTLSTTNYDSILVDWEAYLQAAFPSGTGYTPTISINFGGSKYTLGSAAATARQSLIDNFNWTIVDGGGI